MNNALRRLISDSHHCPPIIRLNVCGIGIGPFLCYDIAKGLLEQSPPLPLSLYLGGNKKIGDPGAAALAAAVKTVSSQQRHGDGKYEQNFLKSWTYLAAILGTQVCTFDGILLKALCLQH